MHWLAHIFGIDTQQSPFYNAWSGCIPALLTSLPIWGGLYVLARRHNCHAKGCPRISRHIHDGALYCSKHHPG